MIKAVGFARKPIGMSNEESNRYHRDIHAPMGKRLVGNRGLEKYIGYYVNEAFSLDGNILPELPWDRLVLESYTDEFFKGLSSWRKTNLDGIKLSKDMEHYTDIKTAMLVVCQDNLIVRPKEDSSGVNFVFLITKRSDISHEECVEYHRKVHAPMVVNLLGKQLKKYIAYYVDYTFNLEKGAMPDRAYDFIIFACFNNDTWQGMDAWCKTPEGKKITEDEEHFADRKAGVALMCQESIFIP